MCNPANKFEPSAPICKQNPRIGTGIFTPTDRRIAVNSREFGAETTFGDRTRVPGVVWLADPARLRHHPGDFPDDPMFKEPPDRGTEDAHVRPLTIC
jgi:hypothetical protein